MQAGPTHSDDYAYEDVEPTLMIDPTYDPEFDDIREDPDFFGSSLFTGPAESLFNILKDQGFGALQSAIFSIGGPSNDPIDEFPTKIQPYVQLISEAKASEELDALMQAIKNDPENLDLIGNLSVKFMEKLTHGDRFAETIPAIGLLIQILGSAGPKALPFSFKDVMNNCSGIVGFTNIQALLALAAGLTKNTQIVKDVLLTLFNDNIKGIAKQCLMSAAKLLAFKP